MPPRSWTLRRCAAAILAASVVLVLTGCDAGDPATPSQEAAPVAPATPTPPGTPATPAAGTAEAKVPPPDRQEATPQLPAAYQRRNVPFTEHISLPVPTGWEQTSTDPYTHDYRDPTGQVLLRVRLDPDARQSPAYDQLERDLREMAETWQGFQYVELEWYYCCQMDLRPDISAAEAEFTFLFEGVTRHALQRVVVYPDLGRVTIHLSAPETHLERVRPVAERAIDLQLAG